MLTLSPVRVVAVAALGLACQAGESTAVFTTTPPTSSTGDGSTTEPGSTSAATTQAVTSDASSSAGDSTSTTTSTTSSTGTTGTSTTGASTFDVGVDKDLGPPIPAGCKGKIDFLFVISGHSVMKVVQEQLIASFPKFIETIASKFEDFDYHIMVVSADGYWGLEKCTNDCPVIDCSEGQPCCGEPNYPCALLDLVTECDSTMGAGMIFPAGIKSSNKICPIADDRRYMVKGQPDLEGTFACAATIGLDGGVQIGSALVAAVGPILNDPGGCNEGFLRDDALANGLVKDYGPAFDAASDMAFEACELLVPG
ncbi:MAG: hypothetical protein R3B09_15875 [Nannocystaceae bacterium]